MGALVRARVERTASDTAMSAMTETQSKVYHFIRDEIEAQGCPPTLWEIAIKFGWKSQNAALSHVDALIRKGLLRKIPETSRGLRIIEVPIVHGVQLSALPSRDVVAEALQSWK